MDVKERIALREPVEGPNGSFMVDCEKDGEVTIQRIVEVASGSAGSSLKKLDYVESHPTVEQAQEAARNLAGLPPLYPSPDRRGAIAHTKECMK